MFEAGGEYGLDGLLDFGSGGAGVAHAGAQIRRPDEDAAEAGNAGDLFDVRHAFGRLDEHDREQFALRVEGPDVGFRHVVGDAPIPDRVGGIAAAQSGWFHVRRTIHLRITGCAHGEFGLFPIVYCRKHDAVDPHIEHLLGLGDEFRRASGCGDAHEGHDIGLQIAFFDDLALVGHAEQEQAQSLDVERRVLHVDHDEVEPGVRQRAGGVEGIVEGKQPECRLVILEQLNQLVHPNAGLGRGGRGGAQGGDQQEAVKQSSQ